MPCRKMAVLAALVLAVIPLTFDNAQARRLRPAGPTPAAARWAAWERHQQLERESWFAGLPWRCVGPVVQGGRLVDIEVSPADPYTFYVAYASGGLWRTTNNGVTFEPLFDDQPAIIMGDVALDPLDENVIWVGTGENNSSRSSYGGLGVFRSDDRGATWRHVGLGDSDRIGRILVDPRDGDRVFVASLGKLYTEGGQRGVYLTEDGGATWTEVLAGDDWTGFVDLVMDPQNPDVLYAAAWERSRRPWNFVEGGVGSGIFKSVDGGRTWNRLEGGFPRAEQVGRIGLTVSASQPEVIYAYVDNQEPLPQGLWDLGDGAVTPKRLRTMTKEEFLEQDPEEVEDFLRGYDLDPKLDAAALFERIENDEVTLEDLLDALQDANANLFDADIHGAQVWRSDDAGATWVLAHEDVIRELGYTYGYYFGQIRVSPRDPDEVFILGVPVLRSQDGGRTWRSVHGRSVHVDHQSMWIDPADDDRILAGNDGGLAVSYDGGESWLVLNRTPVGQFYTIELDDAKPYNVYGGMQDNGVYKGSSRSRPNITSPWQRVGGGDGMYVQVDRRDNATVYLGFQFGHYTRIDADGSRHGVRPRPALGEEALRYNWQTPIELSTHNADILYFGANKVFRSMDQGRTWTAISGDLTRSEARGDVPFATLTTLEESTRIFGLLWAGTDDGQVHVSRDGGVIWNDVGDGLPQDRWISRVVASRHADDRAYVALNGYRDDDMSAYLFGTEDLGGRWSSIAAGLPAEPINVVREDPKDEDILYVGTDRGVYVTLDRGGSWHALQAELPNAAVHDLAVHERDRELVAGTHGRSVWIVDVAPLQQLDEAVRDSSLHVFEVKEIQADRGWRSRHSTWFHRAEDDPTHPVCFWSKDAGPVRLRILDAEQRILREAEVDATAGVNTYTWDLRLDPELALAAERERVAAAEDENDSTRARQRIPWAEAVRLERPLYVTAGTYTVQIERGDDRAQATFEVKAPPARPARDDNPASRPRRGGP